ncbi:MAG: tRNA (N6-isopentenyl adenosine(37)-C2)-methylthiotransferase MiaB [Deltaproteobacteria bacterium]|nr:tRNA (N6-isopentenyl adenosine(37)-C2)-methylthiotransferase MiaB [Deltaproteobacteria bacterium]
METQTYTEDKALFLETFGCQMNERDSERILGFLKGLNYRVVDDPKRADLIIVNTCSIREKAEHKLYSTLGRFKRLKEKRPHLIIGVGGCVAQQEGERLFKRARYLDIVFGTHNIHRLPELVKGVKTMRTRSLATEFYDTIEPEGPSEYLLDAARVKAFVTIMQGCNNFCTYCIVPYVRGREVSRGGEEILEEVRGFAVAGVKEVTLLGQNVNCYGHSSSISFTMLLKMVCGVDGIERVRFVTSHPRDLSDDLINLFGRERKLCRHIHLPIQSGSNRVLQKMNRGYTREAYLEKVYKLRKVCPGIGITTDIIVGFPGETDDDFNATLNLLKLVEFDNIFSFKYSPRPQTSAASFTDQVPEDVKLERLKIVQDLQRSIALRKNQAMAGRVEEVLVEGKSKGDPEELTGRTSCNKIVNMPGSKELVGELIPVRIERAYLNSLRGQVKEGLCC